MITLLLFTLLLLTVLPLRAQDDNTLQATYDVWVTTQDYSSFREGPGINWERSTVIDPAVTLPAIGRTPDSRWIQVVYDGETGWINWNLLVWSGNLSNLPVDGVQPEAFVRQVEVGAVTTRETPLYATQVDPSDQVGTLPEGTEVEVVGRLGSRGYIQMQIRYEGQLYWVGSWNLDVTEGYYSTVLDNTYRYAYGRLIRQFNDDISIGQRRMGAIEEIWRDLQRGVVVSCTSTRIPDLVGARRVSDGDINAEPDFLQAATMLDSAIGYTNTAIAAFTDACNREDRYLTQADVRAALDEVDAARRHYNIARSFVATLRQRDPILNR